MLLPFSQSFTNMYLVLAVPVMGNGLMMRLVLRLRMRPRVDASYLPLAYSAICFPEFNAFAAGFNEVFDGRGNGGIGLLGFHLLCSLTGSLDLFALIYSRASFEQSDLASEFVWVAT